MTKHNRIKSNYRRLKIGTTSNIHSELSKHNGAHKKIAANIADLHEIPHTIPILNMLWIKLNMTLQNYFKEKPISNCKTFNGTTKSPLIIGKEVKSISQLPSPLHSKEVDVKKS